MKRTPILTGIIAAAATLSAAEATLAAPFCAGGGRSGIVVEFGVEIGPPLTEMEENDLYLIRLRQKGVDATMVRQWNGCIQAFVRKPEGGGETIEYYDPDTLQRVY